MRKFTKLCLATICTFFLSTTLFGFNLSLNLGHENPGYGDSFGGNVMFSWTNVAVETGAALFNYSNEDFNNCFEDAILALFVPPIEYDVDQLYQAMKGLGTNEDTLIEIIASRDEHRLNQIKARYKEKYNISLEDAIEDETSGSFKKLLIALLQGGRSQNLRPDVNICKLKAKELYEAGVGKWGNNSSIFNKIFALSSKFELAFICREYYKLYGHSIIDAVDNNFKGDLKTLLKSVIHAIINPSEYFASRINYAIKGFGTKDNLLIRIIVTRDEVDMPMIKRYYKQLYGNNMVDDIKKDTSGDYRKLLIELVDH